MPFFCIFALEIKTAIMKRKYCNLLLMIGFLSLFNVSCVMYHPHNVDIPLLQQGRDLRIDGSVNMTFPFLDGTGANATVSYAPINHLALQASGSITDKKNLYGHFAVGTFQPFGKSVLEFYLGAAAGHSSYSQNRNSSDNTQSGTKESTLNQKYYVEGDYNIFFSQLNFGWNNLGDDLCDVGFGLRSGILKPAWQHVNVSDDGVESVVEEFTTPNFLLEPQLMFRIGGEHLKISFNFAYSFLSDWPTENNYFNYTRFSAGIGLNYKF